MDETGIMMGYQKRALVVVPRATATRYMAQPGSRKWVSILETVSACGQVLPPFVIFQGAQHQLQWYPNPSPSGWKFGISETGWTNNEMGVHWLKGHFEPLTCPTRTTTYRLFLIDGHDSHTSWEFLRFCRAHRIIALCLPLHTTHILQSLDEGCFQSLKAHYTSDLEDGSRRGYTGVDKHRFIKIYEHARSKTFDGNHVGISWKDTGLHPYDPEKLRRKLPSDPLEVIPAPVTPVQSSSPMPEYTPSNGLQTPKNLLQLQHFDRCYQETSVFQDQDASPCRRRYQKILRSAQVSLQEVQVLRQRYNMLLGSYRRQTDRRGRKAATNQGQVLTSKFLNRLEEDLFYNEELTSDSEGEEVEWGGDRGLMDWRVQGSRAEQVSPETVGKGTGQGIRPSMRPRKKTS